MSPAEQRTLVLAAQRLLCWVEGHTQPCMSGMGERYDQLMADIAAAKSAIAVAEQKAQVPA